VAFINSLSKFYPILQYKLTLQPSLAGSTVFLYACPKMKPGLNKQIVLPQDHGSWIFILSPFLVGIFAGRSISLATVYLFITAISAFLIRQPLTALIKATSGRRPQTDLPLLGFGC